MSFPDFLILKGWQPFRKVNIKNEWVYQPCEFKNEYSTLITGYLDYRFLKDGKEIIWGLNEAYKPPTLCSPRSDNYMSDNEMNKIILEKTNEELYEIVCNLLRLG